MMKNGWLKSLASPLGRWLASRRSLFDKSFFLVGCARSGTTSLCRILDRAENAVCLAEPNPNLNVESRQFLDGKLAADHGYMVPGKALLAALLPRMRQNLRSHELYGEKNVSLTAFIRELHELLHPRLLWVTRDGRDVVASMHNWHNHLFGNFYRECKDAGDLQEAAKACLAQLPREADTSDYSRPRPRPGDPYYRKWPDMSRHEMLCWYWAFINRYALEQLAEVPADRWLRVDYSAADRVEEVARAVDFLGLRGVPRDTIRKGLDDRINSVAERTGSAERLPGWRDWSDREVDQFWEIAGETMALLGYGGSEKGSGPIYRNGPEGAAHKLDPTPFQIRRYTPDYGSWWKSPEVGLDFFQSIYHSRLPQHKALMDWARPRLDTGKVRSVCEVACGRGVGYADFFRDCAYTGVDLSQKEIDWCRGNYAALPHRWLCLDFIRNPPRETFDLVFCQGSIENVYDMDALVRSMAGCTRRYLYLTAFKGYFPELQEHVYQWNPVFRCYDNKLSVPRTRALLGELGFADIAIFAQPTHKPDIPLETVVIASREPGEGAGMESFEGCSAAPADPGADKCRLSLRESSATFAEQKATPAPAGAGAAGAIEPCSTGGRG